ncbi:MAG: hypothetical protein LLG05_18565 [Porphyromonadaceae bacterium]|nr:hypothetical protein [Porphyromonadaceae bacterium]
MKKQVLISGTVMIFLFLCSWAFGEDLKISKEYKGTISGTLEYARMQYFLHTKKGEAYCIFYDEKTQEDQLQNLSGQTVKLEGKIKVFKHGGKCIDITPEGVRESASLPASLTTVAGKLDIGKQEDEVPVIKLNGNTIYIGEGGFSLHFEKFFDFGSYQAVLVADNTGGTACPVSYVFITLHSNKSSSVTKSLGNCSDIPKIQQQGKKVTLSFPSFGSASAEKWVYNAGRISKTK